ncbi:MULTISPECIES: TIGR03943 family putative permease subunit [Streptomyces]|uniref:Putative membrane protein n=2 Tax=Streptomyces scabiei TaxID=1930 RepID=C9ZAV9_STRSW|nr:TIGR03943 family protein [Streptomyces scabiei]MBP5905849.1 TIGR03943 family protein [Streptomyces sp. LBUM 1478]MBP5931641.1 TIGR03943 family protein [Streptomyces sp. LBUM 1479]KFG06888.1 membrane protein [Streptomyces scabiei]MDX2534292.1 TIGR03943 family protein [Streptomyces scabiei]MDX2575745.1 TIGR03943 family protein [Streptomyces scabiei]
MKRPLQALLLLLSGLGLLHATLLTDHYLRYVKKGMYPLLVASGALLLVLAAAEAWSLWRRRGTGDREHHDHERTHAQDLGGEDHDLRGENDEQGHDRSHDHGHDNDHGHDHSAPPRVAWLLFLPALSLLLYAPPAIGAYTASREPPKAVTVTGEGDFDPLPKTSPLPMTLTDFTRRVQQDRARAIDGRTVQLTGFVSPDKETAGGKGDGGWYLTRVIFSCCAADAQFVKVRVHDTPAPPADTWVTLTGTWHRAGTLGTGSAAAALDAHGIKKVPRPYNDYTDGLPAPAS